MAKRDKFCQRVEKFLSINGEHAEAPSVSGRRDVYLEWLVREKDVKLGRQNIENILDGLSDEEIAAFALYFHDKVDADRATYGDTPLHKTFEAFTAECHQRVDGVRHPGYTMLELWDLFRDGAREHEDLYIGWLKDCTGKVMGTSIDMLDLGKNADGNLVWPNALYLVVVKL